MKTRPQNRSLLSLRPWRLAAACALALAPAVAHAVEPTPKAGDPAPNTLPAGVVALGQMPKATLKVGDPAPALALKKFVKGEPVQGFEKGKVYVVDFWATWCGPCTASIPQLSELQKKYRDITFIGVDDGEDEKKVLPFLAKMGDKMNYRVALDDLASVPTGATYEAFTDAADLPSTPTAFIVDKNSKIAWIGYPPNLPPVLERIAAGTPAVEKVAAEDADPDQALGTAVHPDLAWETEVSPDLAWAMEVHPDLEEAMEADPIFAQAMESIFANNPEIADLIMTGQLGPENIQIKTVALPAMEKDQLPNETIHP